ncbi:hypothetical protein LCGC14_1715440, partial [marine sediment metagenome]
EATTEVVAPEGGAVPAAEQEPPAGESGASGTEDEAKPGQEATPDPRSQIAETLKALRQEHPDLYDSVLSPAERERLQGGQEERGEEVALRESQYNRRGALDAARSTFASTEQEIRDKGADAFEALETELTRQAKLVSDGQATTITTDFKSVSASIDTMRSDMTRASFGLAAAMYDDAVQDMLETHTSRRYLTAEDRKRIDDAEPKDKLRMRIHAQLDAAIKRGSTAEVRLAAKKEAEETVGLTEHLTKIQALIPASGATGALETGASDGRSDKDVLTDPDTSVERLLEIRNRQKGG